MKSYELTRKFAADILNVSVRTLDRYVKSQHITNVRRGRQLFYDEKELLDFKTHVMKQKQVKSVKNHQDGKNYPKTSSSTQSQREFVDIEEAQILEQQFHRSFDQMDRDFDTIKRSVTHQNPEVTIYKGLYEKAEEELKGVRDKLEIANYQVGKLESQVKIMVPLIEFKKQHQELLALAEENRFKEQDINQLEQQVKLERFVKKLYSIFLFFMLTLMPLLLILRWIA